MLRMWGNRPPFFREISFISFRLGSATLIGQTSSDKNSAIYKIMFFDWRSAYSSFETISGTDPNSLDLFFVLFCQHLDNPGTTYEAWFSIKHPIFTQFLSILSPTCVFSFTANAACLPACLHLFIDVWKNIYLYQWNNNSMTLAKVKFFIKLI